MKLEQMGFGLVCVDKTKPYKWRFSERASVVLFGPGLDPQTALALRLVELHLTRMLPKSTLRALQPHLSAAQKALTGKPVARWLDKVRLIPRSQPLDPPKVDGAIVGVVHEALLEGRQIRARYQARESDHAKEMTLNPLGLVYRDSVAYLVATVPKFTDPRLFPLHRFHDAVMLETRAFAVGGFDLDEYIAAGEIGFRIGDRDIRVELRFTDGAGRAVEETPLHPQQTVLHSAAGTIVVRATVPDTRVLRSWILGFGPHVEVIAPRSLRRAVADAHAAAATTYRRSKRAGQRASGKT
ncbi:MAG: WYL domain-containing protein [Deltaproteobacteria bacterium]|nr:WYL domain-containing protein [Deltaproteobacteria bacterium]